ncbi:MAG: polysaccharide pyruvyl transferase family protein [Pseudomonadota bacterium]
MNYRDSISSVLTPICEGYKKAVLFDFPTYDNVGDLAIWLGEVEFITHTLDIRIIAVEHCQATLLPELDRQTLVFLSGGGNMGDLWPQHERFRLRVLQRYPDHRVVVLPQSIHFTSNEALEKSASITQSHADLFLCVRDAPSAAIAETLVTKSRYRLCPDMALVLGSLPRPISPATPVFALKRSDAERKELGVLSPEIKAGDWVGSSPTFLGRMTRIFDRLQTRYPNRFLPLAGYRVRLYDALAREHLERGLKLLSQAEVVITDRLHAHILCVLLGIPHVVLDNSYGKISRFRQQWKTGEGICVVADSWDEATHAAAELPRSDMRKDTDKWATE